MNHPDDWAQDLYEREFINRNDTHKVDLSKCPPGAKHCHKCSGTGIGAPGEKYYEMGTGTFGCSECHGFGWEPAK